MLLEEGYEVVLVNSNPATIMTDPEFADRDLHRAAAARARSRKIIEKERPDALLPTLGGQTALNLAMALHEDGTLERFGVELIGADYDAIRRAEDREEFRQTMTEAGPADPLVDDGREPRRGRGGAGRGQDHAAGDRPPGLHDGRPGRRRRARPRPSCARSSPRASRRARSTRCWSRSRCSAGASSSSR